MGLAEPKRRIKIANDPRNLAWSSSSTSYGARLMTSQGWREGQSLGARPDPSLSSSSQRSAAEHDAQRLAAARIGVLFKDDNLGLGAKRRARDVEAQRTGLDAFAGLLGRLNGKSDAELQSAERKVEDRKLAMYASGRWGGMVFVPGGLLVGTREEQPKSENESVDASSPPPPSADTDARTKRKEEKRQRKAQRLLRREARAARKAAKKAKATSKTSTTDDDEDDDDNDNGPAPPLKRSPPVPAAPDEPVSSASAASSSSEGDDDADDTPAETSRKRKHARADGRSAEPKPAKTPQLPMRNGRHLLRGRNMAAKRMAFTDAKGLDEIFMKTG